MLNLQLKDSAMRVLCPRRIAVCGVTVTVVKLQPIITFHIGTVVKEDSDPLRGPTIRAMVGQFDHRNHMIRNMEALARLKLGTTEGVNMASYA